MHRTEWESPGIFVHRTEWESPAIFVHRTEWESPGTFVHRTEWESPGISCEGGADVITCVFNVFSMCFQCVHFPDPNG